VGIALGSGCGGRNGRSYTLLGIAGASMTIGIAATVAASRGSSGCDGEGPCFDFSGVPALAGILVGFPFLIGAAVAAPGDSEAARQLDRMDKRRHDERQRIADAADRGQCGEALSIAARFRSVDPKYFDVQMRKQPGLRMCLRIAGSAAPAELLARQRDLLDQLSARRKLATDAWLKAHPKPEQERDAADQASDQAAEPEPEVIDPDLARRRRASRLRGTARDVAHTGDCRTAAIASRKADQLDPPRTPEPDPELAACLRVVVMHARAVAAAKQADCDVTRQIAGQIHAAEPAYYDDTFRPDPAVAPCLGVTTSP